MLYRDSFQRLKEIGKAFTLFSMFIQTAVLQVILNQKMVWAIKCKFLPCDAFILRLNTLPHLPFLPDGYLVIFPSLIQMDFWDLSHCIVIYGVRHCVLSSKTISSLMGDYLGTTWWTLQIPSILWASINICQL